MKQLVLNLIILFLSQISLAMVTELGLSYGYSKKTFNATNYYQTDAKSASVTIYPFAKWAFEFSYTDSFYESHESDSNSTRVVQQSSRITDASVVFMMLSNTHFVQPYLKAGSAYVSKSQVIKYLNASAITIPESTGWAPSYGTGIKIVLSERFSVKMSYELVQTPLSDGTNSDDSSFKAGLNWYL